MRHLSTRGAASAATQYTRETKPLTAPNPLRHDAPPHQPPSTTTAVRPNLTPKFHWNLNSNALELLTADEQAALYNLFRFYDSSYEGDAIPAIHCTRFLEILRDADLLVAHGTDTNELLVPTVEKVFAQAVLGKLRAYLDAEDQPALTFQLFAGALFHCAMLKFADAATPESAFRVLVDKLLTVRPTRGELAPTLQPLSIVQHAEHADISVWSAQSLHHDANFSPADYLQRPVYQDVITGLSHDKLVDHQLRQRLDQSYVLPEELASHFNANMRAFVTEKFKTFDVFDKGTLPRDEVFTFLTSIARKLEINDVYEVMSVLLAVDLTDRRQHPRGSVVLTMNSSVEEVSLATLLNAVYVCRRSRTASYLSTQQANQNRKTAAASAASATASQESSSTTNTTATADSASKTNTTKTKTKHTKPKTNATSTNSPTKTQTKPMSKRVELTKKKSRVDPRPTDANSSSMLRRLSKMSASSSSDQPPAMTGREDETQVTHCALVRQDSGHSLSSSSSSNAALHVLGASTKQTNDWEDDDDDQDHSRVTADSAVLTLRLYNRRTITEGNDSLDGAVCITMQLFLHPHRIRTAQSVYFEANGGRHEVWDAHTQVLDDRTTAEVAVRAVQRLVDEKRTEGFELMPKEAQERSIDALLQAIREASHPRYAATVRSPKRGTTAKPPTPLIDTESSIFKRHSLERGATWVRQRSASDLLAALSDSLLQKHLKMKKHQSIVETPTGFFTPNQRPPTQVRDANTPEKSVRRQPIPTTGGAVMPDHELMARWGLVPRHSWVAVLNEQTNQLCNSASAPRLRSPKCQRPIQLQPIHR